MCVYECVCIKFYTIMLKNTHLSLASLEPIYVYGYFNDIFYYEQNLRRQLNL